MQNSTNSANFNGVASKPRKQVYEGQRKQSDYWTGNF